MLLSRTRVASKLWLPDGRAESQKYGYPQGGHRDADERAGVLQQTARALSEPSPERAQSPGDGDRGGDGLSSQGRAAVFARRAPAPRGPAPGRATPAVRKRRRPGSPGAVGSRRPDRGQAAPAIPAGPARPPRGLWRADGRPDHRAPPPRDQHGDPGTGLGTRAPGGAAQRAEYHAARQLAQAADPPADLRRLERGPARLFSRSISWPTAATTGAASSCPLCAPSISPPAGSSSSRSGARAINASRPPGMRSAAACPSPCAGWTVTT